jgi:hypothetical protein
MRWGEAGHAIWYCDMTRLHNEVGVSSAQAGSGVLSLPPHASQALVRFSSSTGAPRIRLHGPDGRTIDTPAPGVGNSSAARSFISFRDEQGHNTDVLLANTGSGRWTYETLPGSAPVTKLQTARPLPKVSVKASIARKGRTATLRWRLRHIAGQRVTFMEAGPGAPPRIIKVTTAARGHKRFRPFLTRERTRRIVAIVEQDGKPRARVQVARYTAPKLPRVARVPGLRAVRHGSRVIVTWKKMPGAREYRVLLRERSGRRTLHVVKRPRLTLRGARGRAARTLSVRAVGLDGRVAKSRSAKVKKARRRHH